APNATNSEDAMYTPTVIRSANDARGLAQIRELAGFINFSDANGSIKGQKDLYSFINRLSQAALSRFSGMSASQQMSSVLGDRYEQLSKREVLNPNMLDGNQDPELTAIFSANRITQLNSITTNLGNSALAMAKLLVDGYAGAATMTLEGFDYHGDPNIAVPKGRDVGLGRLIGSMLSAFAAKGKPVMIFVYTDGGVVSSLEANADATPDWRGDSGEKSGSVLFVYDPKRSRANAGGSLFRENVLSQVNPRQIGGYELALGRVGAEDTAITSIRQSTVQAQVVLANYLALQYDNQSEIMKKVQEISGSNPIPNSEFLKYVPFKKLA
ncbi:MAG: hypothetical protein KGQ59_07875, partial [Bdellovibrionales bacterium]|nr:hypothetical protein [Bdellovibrionales bacterium]